MAGKPRIIPNRTYVLDPKDLEELEELTIDTVMQEALDSSTGSESDSDEPSPDRQDIRPAKPAGRG
jgi:hypothetical protein